MRLQKQSADGKRNETQGNSYGQLKHKPGIDLNFKPDVCLSFDKKQNNFFVEDKYVKTHGSCKLKLSLENKISSTSQGQSSTLNLMICLSFDKKQNNFFLWKINKSKLTARANHNFHWRKNS